MKKLPLFVENLVKRILRVPAFFIFAGTTQAEFVDIIALNSVPEDETAANVGIISLNNPDLAPPAGFENGFQTARENGRQIRYHIMDGNPNAWSAVVGNGIEYWQDNSGGALGVELCAGPRSRGVKQRFAMEASKDFCGGYALVWNHYGRVPKSGYTVSAYDILPYYDEFFGGTRIVNYRHEAVSMCDKSYSLPAGREPRILFNTSENQQNLNLDQFGFGESHSAQFTLPLQKTFKFWKELKLYLTSEKRNKHEKEK